MKRFAEVMMKRVYLVREENVKTGKKLRDDYKTYTLLSSASFNI